MQPLIPVLLATAIIWQGVPLCSALDVPAAAPPGRLVTVLVPGFKVHELPVRLSNINNLRFRPDGRLIALGYDGRIHLLRDTDNDGLEDLAEPFWDDPTLTVPVGMHWTDQGLYVSSLGKISFFPDRNRDGKADREEIISTNWPPTQTHSGNVDATAITMDPEGNLYFALLTANYANPYLLKDDVPRYDLNSRRGTIQKLSLKTKTLETVVTGVRVPYQLAFNKHGDLFVTDQEGETWCPNGNPFDELNHVIAGRNYGFPPRHEKYLPNLISDPPVVSFGPQHQSTCGFVFNEPSPRQKLFGPSSWEDDAFVAGESRGKIFRVPLVKSASGYVGKEITFARLRMLTTDVAISPAGDLYVSCHSGKPDWGTGPKGEGKLFKISFENPAAPQPVSIWAANQMEVRVAFDKPIPPVVTNVIGEIRIDFGEHVRPADRLENLKPPYKTVTEQERTPRGQLKVVAAILSEDQRTLILTTDPHAQSVSYAISLPRLQARDASAEIGGIDLGYDLTGFAVEWRGQKEQLWTGWLPHVDSEVNRSFTIGSAEHEKLFALISGEGMLTLQGRFIPPYPQAMIHLEANAPFEVALSGLTVRSTNHAGRHVVKTRASTTDEQPSVTIRVKTGEVPQPALHAAYFSSDDLTLRPLPLSAFRVPWAPLHRPAPATPQIATELAGGDFERGKKLFFSEQLKCSACHRLREEGATTGPDLSNLAHRDPGSVLRDIREPNAQINPDYVGYNLALKDGTELTGFVRAQTASKLRVVDTTSVERIIDREEIKEMHVSDVSLMPAGLLEERKDQEIRDLLVFLLNQPPVRNAEEIDAVLRTSVSESGGKEWRTLRVVLVANKQDHGPGQHDYPSWQTNMNQFLSGAAKVRVENAWEWPSAEQFESADVIVFYYWNRAWKPEKFVQMDRYLARGGGMVLFHSSTISDNAPEQLAERIGLAAHPVRVKYVHAPMDLKFVAPKDHPIAAGFKKLHLLDEPYWPMIGDTNRITVLATSEQEGADHPMIWTVDKNPGRVFVSIAGHYTWTHQDPLFRILSLRAIAWSAKEDTSRFLPLIKRTSPVAKSSE
jgi:putative heme-binding domain-containing protein